MRSSNWRIKTKYKKFCNEDFSLFVFEAPRHSSIKAVKSSNEANEMNIHPVNNEDILHKKLHQKSDKKWNVVISMGSNINFYIFYLLKDKKAKNIIYTFPKSFLKKSILFIGEVNPTSLLIGLSMLCHNQSWMNNTMVNSALMTENLIFLIEYNQSHKLSYSHPR